MNLVALAVRFWTKLGATLLCTRLLARSMVNGARNGCHYHLGMEAGSQSGTHTHTRR